MEYQMLMNTEKPKDQSSTSQPFGASGRSSRASEQGSRPEKEIGREMTAAAPEIQAAQRLLARIAVRIVTEKNSDEQ
jgi:hypothetical protein